MKRRDLLKAGAAGSLLPALAIGQTAKVLKFVPQADLALLDPVQTTGLVTRNHAMMVFDTLYGVDNQFQAQPQMVSGHQITDDGKTWTLTLRDKLTFHDGTPVLARDAVASIERWSKVDVLGQLMRGQLDELSAPTDKTLRFRFKKPFPLLPLALSKTSGMCPIMPARLAATDPGVQVTEMIGSGPFRFVSGERVPGSRAVYHKFSGYVPREGTPAFTSGAKIAYVDRVEWHTIPDAATAAAALQSGEVDWWEQPIPDLIPVLRGHKDINVQVHDKAGSMAMIRFNQLHAPFDKAAVRRALLAGITQSDYMMAAMGEDKLRWRDNVGFFLPGTPSANDAGMSALTSARSIEKAKKDLAAAGYKGEKIVMLVPTDFAVLNAMSEVAGDYFKRVGLNLDYQSLDWGTVLQRLASKQPIDKGGWSVFCNFVPGVITTAPPLHTYMRGTGAKGPFGWPESAKHEALLESYFGASTTPDQQRIAREMQLQAFQDVPYIPTGLLLQPAAYRKSVSGILDGSPLFYNVKKT